MFDTTPAYNQRPVLHSHRKLELQEIEVWELQEALTDRCSARCRAFHASLDWLRVTQSRTPNGGTLLADSSLLGKCLCVIEPLDQLNALYLSSNMGEHPRWDICVHLDAPTQSQRCYTYHRWWSFMNVFTYVRDRRDAQSSCMHMVFTSQG